MTMKITLTTVIVTIIPRIKNEDFLLPSLSIMNPIKKHPVTSPNPNAINVNTDLNCYSDSLTPVIDRDMTVTNMPE